MKQVININFQGRIVPIEVSAYEILKNYIESLTRHFAGEEGKEEIINDIESRIGELFQERLKAGATCIVDADVHAVINSIGRPEDFDDAQPAQPSGASTGYEQTQQQYSGTSASGKRRLYRDENHKLVGGVCSGIANYFDVDLVVIRVLFLILLFSFGIGFIPYIILWIAVPSSAVQVIGSRKKKLFRDTDDKYLGGVCSGIANYFGINVWIPRLLFLLPMITLVGRHNWDYGMGFFPDVLRFSPGAIFIYIILWLVLPEAKTTTEKLEMKGEKVDINSIKYSVVEEMKGVQERAQKFGKEVINVASEKGRAFGSDASMAARKGGRSLGDIIIFLVKAFAYFVIGIIGISLVIALFSAGIAAVSYFPLKDFVLRSGEQNIYSWGTLIFFILVPVVGVITWIIRKIAKIKAGSKMLRLSFIAMWILGWVSVMLLAASVSRDFKYNANIYEQNVPLINPAMSSLEIADHLPGASYTRQRWFNGNLLNHFDEDTFLIRNVAVQIARSPNDSFKVTTITLASSNTRRNADSLASLIKINSTQQDSVLIANNEIAINKTSKLRNQRAFITVYVPIGKKIKVSGNFNRANSIHFNGPFSIQNNNGDDDLTVDNLETGWDQGVWYTMTKDGLVSENGKPANFRSMQEDENGEENNFSGANGSYRYDTDNRPVIKDSLKIKMKQEELQKKDSLRKAKERINMELEKMDVKNNAGTARNDMALPLTNFLVCLY